MAFGWLSNSSRDRRDYVELDELDELESGKYLEENGTGAEEQREQQRKPEVQESSFGRS